MSPAAHLKFALAKIANRRLSHAALVPAVKGIIVNLELTANCTIYGALVFKI